MIMINKRRGVIDAILGPENSEAKDKMEGPDEGLSMAAEEFIKAVKADDTQGVMDSFKAMFAACEAEPHDEYDPDKDGM